MPISCQDIIDRVRQALDAEENPVSPELGYYSDAKDIIPNINNAVKWVISIVNAFLEEKKFSSEIFREITYTRIFYTSKMSRIGFNPIDLGHSVSSILAVYPEPVMFPAFVSPPKLAHDYDSIYITGASFVSSTKNAKRLTFGEWNKSAKDPLEDGNLVFTSANAPQLVSYVYMSFSNYTSTAYAPGVAQEIEIRPVLSNAFCGVAYVAIPPLLTAGTDDIPFPETATNIIYEKALSLIAQKQGDQLTLNAKTDEELSQLIKSII